MKAYLRQLKLEMAMRLKVADNKAGRIFRCLYDSDGGTFENDVRKGIQEWLLSADWLYLSKKNITVFKKTIQEISKSAGRKSI